MKDTSKDDFITYWSEQVATQFGLDASDIEASYAGHQTDSDLRTLWKYAAGKGVHATPTAFVNGAYLDDEDIAPRAERKVDDARVSALAVWRSSPRCA